MTTADIVTEWKSAEGWRYAKEACAIMTAIDSICEEEGACVELCGANQDGVPNYIVDVTASWTNWEPEQFAGETRSAALAAAIEVKNQREAHQGEK